MGECCSNGKCGCACHSKESSQSQQCCCPCHKKESCHDGGQHEEFAKSLLDIADAAWTEVLKDKIKEYILSTQNDRMTELAKILAEGNNQRWRSKMEGKQSCMDFREKLGRFFGQGKK